MAHEESYRRKIIRVVTFLAGVYFFLEFLLPESVLQSIGVADLHSEISNGFIVVGTMAFGLGIINLFRVHGTRVVFRRKDWPFSSALLVGLITMMAVTICEWRTERSVLQLSKSFRTIDEFTEVIVQQEKENRLDVPKKNIRIEKLVEAAHELTSAVEDRFKSLQGSLPTRLDELSLVQFNIFSHELEGKLNELHRFDIDGLQKDSVLIRFGNLLGETAAIFEKILRIEYEHSTIRKVYTFMFEGLFVALGSAMFSLLGVYIASAAYRAFRIRSMESMLMMFTAMIVMLGQIPFYGYISEDLPEIRLWLLEVPNSAAFRAIKIGASIAFLVMAFRMWFSIESESFSPRGGKG